MQVSLLRFSQDSIGASLQNGRTLAGVEEDLHARRYGVRALCPLNVVRYQGRWFSRDNRRLYILRRVLLPTQRVYVRYGHVDELFLAHFSTEDEGRTIRVREGRASRVRGANRRPPPTTVGDLSAPPPQNR